MFLCIKEPLSDALNPWSERKKVLLVECVFFFFVFQQYHYIAAQLFNSGWNPWVVSLHRLRDV